MSGIFEPSPFMYLKVELEITTWSYGFSAKSISTSLFKKNFGPINGKCSIDKIRGLAIDTNFTITCQNWIDPDGEISKYEYYGKLNY